MTAGPPAAMETLPPCDHTRLLSEVTWILIKESLLGPVDVTGPHPASTRPPPRIRSRRGGTGRFHRDATDSRSVPAARLSERRIAVGQEGEATACSAEVFLFDSRVDVS